ncbi:DNA-3-methyladenine glycosylase I [Thalassotalea ponticola]|uniref:DNA-3-methyladenine glycosylase I n=1 Tax=Thalassotalea ponticola TaxID=1523392 RepID=UPI0025B612A6|nr:DNA-3-methyladenine glycosylase I [Thalassotalea ponticola]MDN3651464.1 DNA-3-methyladenine glycosylase I [Thalassotalea ponticola]
MTNNSVNESQTCRCPWLDLSKPDYVAYHDLEWGVPVKDDQTMFEFLTLESAQAGLSWYTVLKKREHYRRAFANFDVDKVANFDQQTIEQLLQNPGIIRNRLKVQAAVTNAQRVLILQQEFGSLCNYFWQFVDHKPIVNQLTTLADYPATSTISDAISKDMKQRGFKFVGSTIIYAHMQACGLVNDHSVDCYRRQQIIDQYR